jgi:hypothetical protein
MYLDISKHQPKYWKKEWGYKIPLVKGKYSTDYDLDVAKIKPEVYKIIVKKAMTRHFYYDKSKPVGLDKNQIPPDCKIIYKKYVI